MKENFTEREENRGKLRKWGVKGNAMASVFSPGCNASQRVDGSSLTRWTNGLGVDLRRAVTVEFTRTFFVRCALQL